MRALGCVAAAAVVLVIAVIALGAAWFALGEPTLPRGETIPQGAQGKITLTASEPIASRRVMLAFPAAGQQVRTWAQVTIDAPTMTPEPVQITVIREADGTSLELQPGEPGLQTVARTFTPFTSCGPDVCDGWFTITFRLTGSDLGTVFWGVYTRTEFSTHPGGDPRPTIEIEPSVD